MAGFEVKSSCDINSCKCGEKPTVIGYYIKGTANRLNFFVVCKNCKRRSRNRRKRENAIYDWNNNICIK